MANIKVVDTNGNTVPLEIGAWYVGINWRDTKGAGEIAQYVGEGEFYDEDSDEPTNFGEYEYIVFSHSGTL